MRTSQNHPAEETKPFEGVGSVKVDDKMGVMLIEPVDWVFN